MTPPRPQSGLWAVAVDTGGTFTDARAQAPDGRVERVKVLSSGAVRGRVVAAPAADRVEVAAAWMERPDLVRGATVSTLPGSGIVRRVVTHDATRRQLTLDGPLSGVRAGTTIEVRTGEPAPLLAARVATGTPADEALPPLAMRLATTWGTNALLERRGARVAFFVTEGFGDLLRIGDQQRPDLFALAIEKPVPLAEDVYEVAERMEPDGTVERPVDRERVRAAALEARRAGCESAAIALLHAYRNPAHEDAVAEVLREAGFRHVSVSSTLAPLITLLTRAETTVVDAYLRPVVTPYLVSIEQGLGGPSDVVPPLEVMTSAGGLMPVAAYRACDSLLSGPAGGVAGAAAAGREAGIPRVIGLDMGGTSTDVARIDGDFEYRYEHRVAGVRLAAPALDIETVAAGGGSICRWADGALAVGPASAGADPGPAAYGAGGPLTLTDVNLLCGYLDASSFGMPIDSAPAATALAAVAGASDRDPDALLDAFRALADDATANAIREVSIRRGADPRDYALLAFGGAGGQHVCRVAGALMMSTVVVPPDASILSAVGLAGARPERFAARQVLRPLDDVAGDLPAWFDALADAEREHLPGGPVAVRCIVRLRLRGQESTLDLVYTPGIDLPAAFGDAYRARYAHEPPARPIEVESLRVRVTTGSLPAVADPAPDAGAPAPPTGVRRARFDGAWIDAPVFDRAALPTGAGVTGPALIDDAGSSFVVERGWSVVVHEHGALVARRSAVAMPPGRGEADSAEAELFTQRFSNLAREMGHVLARTALSVNVRERLDFSCALLDPEGRLVVNAPHIPVHLGALGVCVRAVTSALDLGRGDVAITNHPAFGGSHLPDVTVITPIDTPGGLRLGYAASRAHHAEIGGRRPGSMPPDATRLADEGVVIAPRRLVHAGRWCDDVDALLRAGSFPSRAPDDNRADLEAQVAANARGVAGVLALAETHGTERVLHHMAALETRAAALGARALRSLPDGVHRATQHLDDGTPIAVEIRIDGARTTIDFAGTGPQHPGNLNATPAIVRSAVLYVLRLLVGEPLPLNEGLLRGVDLRIPPGLLAPTFTGDPRACPAVVGGNVETSQRVVDTLLGALGLAAASQGTMNNLLFGDRTFGYYETIGGGAGATAGHAGADGVHTHMTNTRITDPEIIEHRYPVRLEAFTIAAGTGGRGRWRGGDGLLRRYRFLRPLEVSILAQRRASGPYGCDGGEPGRPGAQRLLPIGAPGTDWIDLPGTAAVTVAAGDRLEIRTPGGGGWGPPSK